MKYGTATLRKQHTLPAAQPNDRKQAALHNPYLKFFHLKIST